MAVTVFKVGGSLLDLPDLPDRLARLLAQRSHRLCLLVCGGGPAADLVRRWDRVHQLGHERAHWLALKSLELNEALLHNLLPQSQPARNRDEAEGSWQSGHIPVLSALEFIRLEEAASELTVPHDWAATSDTIAAWIALRWPASELVLVKSVSPPRATDPEPPASPPDIDTYFPEFAKPIPIIGWVNLRDPQPQIENWSPVWRPASRS